MPKPAMLVLFAAVVAASPALADTPGSARRIAATESRDSHQETRITNGIAGGTINAAEAARLNSQQARIDNGQARLAADGNFSRRDYARINYRQSRASSQIFRARNNRR